MRNSSFPTRRKKRHLQTEHLEPRLLLAGDVLITELMASNNATLLDQDRDSSDWVELHNQSNSPINLDGWYLTDDKDEFTKWQFPAVDVEPGGYLVVFASDKDRAVAGSELHANFKLSSAGDYLAIVEPDGTTVSHVYDPFPEQFTDVSYGTEQTTVVTTLVADGAEARVLLPSHAAEDVAAGEWTVPGFDDSAWLERNTGIGFGVDGQFDAVIDPDGSIAQMQYDTASAYLRTTFDIDGSVPNFDGLQLDINYDDGFLAYLNGSEIASRNAPSSLAWNAVATAERGGVLTSLDFDNFNHGEEQSLFTLNGHAFWALNQLGLTSAAASQSAAAWMTDPVGFGADYSFSTSMAIDVITPGGLGDSDGPGGHGMTFVLQSGGQFRLGASGGALGLDQTGMQFVAVEFDSWNEGSFDDEEDLASHIGIDTSVEGSVARVAVPRFNGTTDTSPRYVWIDYDGRADVMEVYFSSSVTKPASPTLSTPLDLEAVFDGVPSLWAGWTAATGDEAWNSHKVLDWEITTFGSEPGLVAETIDVSEFSEQLRTGENVLAIHGLNSTTDDADFLIRPTLVATQDNVVSPDLRSYFSEPTPGAPNTPGVQPPAGSVTVSVTSRTFAESFELVISPPSPTVTVRYTTDGSVPDEDSAPYTEPLRIRTTTRIRARAFEPGRAPGPVTSHSYIALGSSLTNFEGGVFESNLPLMVFDSFGGNVHANARNLVPVSGVFIGTTDGRANLLDEPEFAGRAGLRIRGQSSQGWPKKQYALEIWDEGNSDVRAMPASQADDLSVSFFGLPAESDWVLNGPYSDKTQLNNYLTFLWSNRIGQYAPRGRLVEVFVNTDAGRLDYRTDYRGTYVLLEKIKIDAERVAITELSPADVNEPEISGGYIWKYDKDGAGDINFSTTFQGRAGTGRSWKFVEPQRPVREQRSWLRGHLIEFENALYGRNFADPEQGYAKYIDVDSWIDTWLLVELTKNIDGFRLSTYYHKDRGGKIKQGPAWDYNLSLANANYLQGAYPTGWYHDQISQGDYPYWDRLFTDPNFVTRLHDRWFELRQTVFSTENLLSDIDEAVARLTGGSPNFEDPAPGEPSNPISRNFDRWGTINTYLWPNCFFGNGACPASPLPGRSRPDSYEDYIFIMQNFLEERTEWMDQQFGIPPTISPLGGLVDAGTEVTIDASTSGTLYYTLDGTEPQHNRRNRPDKVFEYTGPITIGENSIVTARLLRGSNNWSGKTSASYFVTVPSIVISELHYDPASPSSVEEAVGFSDSDAFEFIELLNFGSEPVNLGGVQFIAGVEFAFGDGVLNPGERAILARNEAAFVQRYGNAINVVGQYGNPQDPTTDYQLSNSGERVAITGPLGVPIMDFTYQDGWHPLTDGEGFSLVIREMPVIAATWSDASAWRPSDFAGGSPGSADTGFAPLPNSIVINEVVSNSSTVNGDTVELYNATNTAIPIGHFYFSDEVRRITKFKIPSDVTVPAQSYLLLDSTLMGPEFAVADLGGELTLQAADSFGSYTGFRASETFGTADVDSAVGRYETSSGLSDFTALTLPTLGAKNAPPVIGPVVINELHYHPASGHTEFVELHNISAQDVDLGDGWTFVEGIDFEFPSGATIPANGYTILIQGADAGDQAQEVRDFRAEFQVPEQVGIHVYTAALNGGLNNGGEAVALARRDAPQQFPVVVDRVDYSDRAPFPPRADGLGPSLSRIAPGDYGNDPTNWKGGIPGGTPGVANLLEDATPPTTPTNLAARIQEDGRAALGWTPSVDLDGEVDHYGIYRNGRLIGTSPIARYVDDVMVGADSSLMYEVSAYNRDGFASGKSTVYDVGVRAVSFQQGTDGYAGTSDAEILQAEPNVNNAPDRRLEVDGDDPAGTNQDISTLIRWDNISIPAGSTVVGARVTLNVANPGDDYDFKRLRTSWSESEVSWNQAANGRPWQVAGARGDGDVGGTVATLTSRTREIVTTTLNASGVRMVQDWIDNPSVNHGMIIVDPGSAANNIFFDSSEATTRSNRPKLTIFSVPDLPPPVRGDFNLDDAVDGADIDLIYAALAANVSDPVFDLNRDGVVDQGDVDELVESVLETRYGDADLDGAVQFDDFLALASNFGSLDPVQAWNQGDFDGDGKAQFSDFLKLSANFGYQRGRAATAAVPPRKSFVETNGSVTTQDKVFADGDTGSTAWLDPLDGQLSPQASDDDSLLDVVDIR